ncbi:MAG: RnfABCDGE type electron transport complex subunit D [Lachnospiraceae bacterium]|nr:RnfABCDGE type electron transport complex subunit D [Lachnospiraceae bacterium]MBR4145444.1 RnfABCDGE type electron transport complex subunit D [Lachnospiraceae bacterium]MBR6476659.1 RnfABCDGE type electron transport complex subunit D [Lachnospiraceae bacterium]
MKDLYNVSASPHVRSGVTTRSIMRDVAIALIPASAFGVYQFGFKAFLVLLTSVASACVCEFLWKRFVVKKSTPYECSALVTGLLLGMNLPASVPLWIPVVGSAFAILVVKEMFGGLGQNFMNPALGARCFLLICFAGRMTAFGVEKASSHFMNGAAAVDGISSATPLAVIKNLEAGQSITGSVSLFDMFFGFTGGVIGETSTIAILIGAAYLLAKKIISLRIPVAYIATFSVFVVIFGGYGLSCDGFYYLLCELCGGGLMLGAWFMATDYVTSPITKGGQIVFGIVLGLLTGIIRICGNSAEGVSYAIIFSNLLVPFIEKFTMPRAFGIVKKKKGGAAK